MARRAAESVAIAIVLTVVGLAIWMAGLIAVGQYSEDICFEDLVTRPGYGAYHLEVTRWPPSFECQLSGPDVAPTVVQHRVVGVAGLLGGTVIPTVYAISALAVLALWLRHRRADSAGSPL